MWLSFHAIQSTYNSRNACQPHHYDLWTLCELWSCCDWLKPAFSTSWQQHFRILLSTWTSYIETEQTKKQNSFCDYISHNWNKTEPSVSQWKRTVCSQNTHNEKVAAVHQSISLQITESFKTILRASNQPHWFIKTEVSRLKERREIVCWKM